MVSRPASTRLLTAFAGALRPGMVPIASAKARPPFVAKPIKSPSNNAPTALCMLSWPYLADWKLPEIGSTSRKNLPSAPGSKNSESVIPNPSAFNGTGDLNSDPMIDSNGVFKPTLRRRSSETGMSVRSGKR